MARKMIIEIELGNDACQDQFDAWGILEAKARGINRDGEFPSDRVRDSNGNTVGRVYFEGGED